MWNESLYIIGFAHAPEHFYVRSGVPGVRSLLVLCCLLLGPYKLGAWPAGSWLRGGPCPVCFGCLLVFGETSD